jgi:hypothetical protein
MRDPTPENITGSKTVSHTVNHTVRWDYVLIAVTVLYAFYKFSGWLESTDSDGEALENGVEVLFEDREKNQGLAV